MERQSLNGSPEKIPLVMLVLWKMESSGVMWKARSILSVSTRMGLEMVLMGCQHKCLKTKDEHMYTIWICYGLEIDNNSCMTERGSLSPHT